MKQSSFYKIATKFTFALVSGVFETWMWIQISKELQKIVVADVDVVCWNREPLLKRKAGYN